MTEILVDPPSIQSYAGAAQRYFDALRADLKGLVDEVVGVRYEGGNAFTFKTEAGDIATRFANSLATDIATVADAISVSTSNILVSLGNPPVRISVSADAFVAPAPSARSESVAVETDGLESLVGTVSARFDSIRGWITSNQTGLEATVWEGTAKRNAVEQVSGFTAAATTKANTAQESLVNYIRKQIESVLAADV